MRRIILGAVVGVVAALVGAVPAMAGYVAAFERVVPGQGFDIALVDAGSGATIALPSGVNTAADELHPSLSADGRHLAFERTQDLLSDLSGNFSRTGSRTVLVANLADANPSTRTVVTMPFSPTTSLSTPVVHRARLAAHHAGWRHLRRLGRDGPQRDDRLGLRQPVTGQRGRPGGRLRDGARSAVQRAEASFPARRRRFPSSKSPIPPQPARLTIRSSRPRRSGGPPGG